MNYYKVWVTTDCNDEDPYTFLSTVKAPDETAAMARTKGLLAQSYQESFAKGIVTGPAWITWWLDGAEDQKERTLMTAVVGSSH